MNKYIKALPTLAGCLGILQGAIWALLCLMGILVHTEAWKPTYSYCIPELSYNDIIQMNILGTFLIPDTIRHPDAILTPTHFMIWMTIYFAISIVWAVTSGQLLYVLKKESVKLESHLKVWSYWTILICLVDFIVTIMCGIDYGLYTKHWLRWSSAAQACGIMLTLAARGFVLWIVNAAIATVLLLNRLDLKDQTPSLTNSDRHNRLEATSNPGLAEYSSPQYDYNNLSYKLGNAGKPGGTSIYSEAPTYAFPVRATAPSPGYDPTRNTRIPRQPTTNRPEYNYVYNNRR